MTDVVVTALSLFIILWWLIYLPVYAGYSRHLVWREQAGHVFEILILIGAVFNGVLCFYFIFQSIDPSRNDMLYRAFSLSYTWGLIFIQWHTFALLGVLRWRSKEFVDLSVLRTVILFAMASTILLPFQYAKNRGWSSANEMAFALGIFMALISIDILFTSSRGESAIVEGLARRPLMRKPWRLFDGITFGIPVLWILLCLLVIID